MSTPCPEIPVLHQLLAGVLAPAQEAELDAHLSGCPACRQLLEQATRLDWTPSQDTLRVGVAGARRRFSAQMPAGVPLDQVLAGGDGAASAPVRPGSALPVDLPPIEGYELLERVGGGGSGEVYRAHDRRLGRTVAVKLLRAAPGGSTPACERFRREAQVLARLNHPGLVTVFDVGETHGQPYLVMEYVQGPTLSRAAASQPQPPGRVAAVVEALARALHQAHEAGLIHRDLKPANVLLQRDRAATPAPEGTAVRPPLDGTPRIIDFGLAKDLQAAQGLTVERDILGTPGYMAPEQARGRHAEIGPATDVYGLGAILYELLTGRPPHREDDPLRTLLAVSFDEPVSIHRLRHGVPRDLETICQKCLEKDPRRRYPSAAALADDLRRFLDGFPIQARPPGFWGRSLRWVRREPTKAALLGLGTTLLVALAIGGPALALRESRRAQQMRALARDAQLQAEVARRERTLAQQERDRANQNFQLARSAVGRMSDLLLQGRGSLEQNRPTPMEIRLHDVAQQFQDQFVSLRSDDSEVNIDQAEGLVRRGILNRQLVQNDDWQRNIALALERFDALERQGQLPPERRYYWAVALIEQTELLDRARQPERARQVLQQAMDRAHDLWQLDPDRVEWFVLWARIQFYHARHLTSLPEQIQIYRTLFGLIQERIERGAPSELLEQTLEATGKHLGDALLKAQDPQQAEQVYRQAFAMAETLCQKFPASTVLATHWATLGADLAQTLERLGRPREAAEVYDQVLNPVGERGRRLETIAPVLFQGLVIDAAELYLRTQDYDRIVQLCRVGLPRTFSDAIASRLQLVQVQALVRLGRIDPAVGIAEDLSTRSFLPSVWLPPLAETLMQAAQQLRHPGAPGVAPEPDRADRLEAQAVAWLERALDNPVGPNAGVQVRQAIQAIDWSPLKARADFQQLGARFALQLP